MKNQKNYLGQTPVLTLSPPTFLRAFPGPRGRPDLKNAPQQIRPDCRQVPSIIGFREVCPWIYIRNYDGYTRPESNIFVFGRFWIGVGWFGADVEPVWAGCGPVLACFWQVLDRFWPGVEDPEGRILLDRATGRWDAIATAGRGTAQDQRGRCRPPTTRALLKP